MENRTKIMVWNLTRFEISKILNSIGPLRKDQQYDLVRFGRMLNDIYLWWTIKDLDPDIFILIEVMTTKGPLGTLVEGGGQQGLGKVLKDLRKTNPSWCMIPSVRLTNNTQYTEGIGVFYRSDRLLFTGPWDWPAAPVPPVIGDGPEVFRAIEPGTANAGAYPSPWDKCLPAESATKAARCTFFNSAGELLDFNQQQYRKPFVMTFKERHDYERTIHLAAVHLPPPNEWYNACLALQNVVQIMPGFDEDDESTNTVSIVTGDFNLDLNTAAIRNQIEANNNDPKMPNKIYPDDWLFGAPLTSNYLLWKGSNPDRYLGSSLYDNALIRYSGGGTFAPDHRGFVGDIVNGEKVCATSETDMPDPPKTVLMAYRPPAPSTHHSTVGKAWRTAQNYGHVGVESGLVGFPGLSDHRPIYFEV